MIAANSALLVKIAAGDAHEQRIGRDAVEILAGSELPALEIGTRDVLPCPDLAAAGGVDVVVIAVEADLDRRGDDDPQGSSQGPENIVFDADVGAGSIIGVDPQGVAGGLVDGVVVDLRAGAAEDPDSLDGIVVEQVVFDD